MAASRARRTGQQTRLPRTERDIPIGIVAVVTLVCLAPIAVLLANFDSGGALSSKMPVLVIGGVVFIALMSFFVSSVCGYMAGLIGASNSPLSGIGILAVIGAALLMVVGVRPYLPASAQPALVAYALFVTAVVFAAATIANNNLQDLKTGQLVDATPWKQQVALVIGVAAGALIIPPILDLLNHAYGFAGAPGLPRANPLPAPQAGLISALAQGVLQNNVDWSLIRVGVAIGVGMIVIDQTLRRTTGGRVHLSPLAVGLGIYLPTQSTLMVVLGALAGWYFDRRAEHHTNPAAVKQLGILLASGLIVGEGLVGVLIAALVAFSGKNFPLSLVGDHFAESGAVVLSCIAFTATMFFMYRWVARLHR
jgi:putative OPT family oligopeptide transporter